MRRRRSNKGTYLILALICLILLNIGSITILFLGNKDIPVFNIKDIIYEVFRISDKSSDSKMDKDDLSEREIDRAEDFIIINPLNNYENLIIVRDSKGKGSIENIPESLNIEKVNVDKTKPYIFLYHTHATESYIPFVDDTYYSENNDKNVVKIGDTLATVLKANGHNVNHSLSHHDRPSYSQSYSRSLKTIQDAKNEESNLHFFFDIHRDGIDKNATYYESFLAKAKTNIDGKDVATFSLVVGPDTPNYDKVLDFAKFIKIVADMMYPDLCTGIIVKPYGKFNLYISDYSALIEIGSNLNTLDEANECAKYVGEILDTVLRSLEK